MYTSEVTNSKTITPSRKTTTTHHHLQTGLCHAGLQLADVLVQGASLIGSAIHPRTLCCKKTGTIEPLKGITTLEACARFCGKLKLQPLQLGAGLFACKRPKYACDQTGVGAQCGACYKAGTCYLIPFVAGIRAGTKTEITKKRLAEQEQRENVFGEHAHGVRETGLGGIGSTKSHTSGRSSADETKVANILTKRVTTSLATENFGGFPSSPLGPKDFLGGSPIAGYGGKIGRNGAIKQTKETQLADRKRLLNTNSRLAKRKQDNFVQDLRALGPGQSGSFASRGSGKELITERGRRAETEKAQTVSKKLALSGTAAAGFHGGGGGPVELLQQNRQVAGTENELRQGTRISSGTIQENLARRDAHGAEIASLRGRKTERTDVQKAIRGRTLGRQTVRQVATDHGLNQDLRSSQQGERQTNTAARSSGSFVALEKRAKKCAHCTSTLEKLTSGKTYGGSKERLQEQSRSNVRRSLRGRAGQGATIATTGTEVNKFRRAKQAGSGSDVQQRYRGTNSHLSATGLARGHVSGSAATRTRRRSYETEEGVSVADVKAFDVAGFPTKVKGHVH